MKVIKITNFYFLRYCPSTQTHANMRLTLFLFGVFTVVTGKPTVLNTPAVSTTTVPSSETTKDVTTSSDMSSSRGSPPFMIQSTDILEPKEERPLPIHIPMQQFQALPRARLIQGQDGRFVYEALPDMAPQLWRRRPFPPREPAQDFRPAKLSEESSEEPKETTTMEFSETTTVSPDIQKQLMLELSTPNPGPMQNDKNKNQTEESEKQMPDEPSGPPFELGSEEFSLEQGEPEIPTEQKEQEPPQEHPGEDNGNPEEKDSMSSVEDEREDMPMPESPLQVGNENAGMEETDISDEQPNRPMESREDDPQMEEGNPPSMPGKPEEFPNREEMLEGNPPPMPGKPEQFSNHEEMLEGNPPPMPGKPEQFSNREVMEEGNPPSMPDKPEDFPRHEEMEAMPNVDPKIYQQQEGSQYSFDPTWLEQDPTKDSYYNNEDHPRLNDVESEMDLLRGNFDQSYGNGYEYRFPYESRIA